MRETVHSGGWRLLLYSVIPHSPPQCGSLRTISWLRIVAAGIESESPFLQWPHILHMKQGRHIKQTTTITPALLQVQGLCFRYPGRELFADWSTAILPGLTLLRGGDGCGKTTLLRLLAGTLPADAGQLRVHDVCLQEQPAAYRQQVFWAEPRSADFDHLTPVEYLESLRGRYPGFDDQVLADLVDGLALAPHMNKQLHMLSAGSKRKVWLAAAFASGAAVTLLDEPFAALDKASIGLVMALLEEAADHPGRAWVIADYEAPAGLRLADVIDLGD